jgi:hypothetical protein
MLTVSTNEDEEGKRVISDIWWDSVNILRKDPMDESRLGWFAPRDQKYKFGELVEYLSQEIVLPLQQLRVELDFPYTSGAYIIWPAGFEVQKPPVSASSEQS